MEAEVLELPRQEAAPQKKDSYGTAAPKKTKKNYDGFVVVLCVLAVILGSLFALIGLRGLRLTRTDGKLTLRFGSDQEQEDPGVIYQPLNPDWGEVLQHGASTGETGPALRLQETADGVLSPAELYDKVADAVVCLTVHSLSGDVTGTGVILSRDGYLLTSAALYDPTVTLTAQCREGASLEAEFVGYDAVTGLALVKAQGKELPCVEFGTSQDLRVGDTVYSVGNPNGAVLTQTLTAGMVSAKQTSTVSGRELGLLQTTAVFETDPNGCPIFNSAGQVVALTSTLYVEGAELRCAVTAENVLQTVQRLLDPTEAACDAGFTVEQIPEQYRRYYGYPGYLWISGVTVGSAADGLLYEYDVITAVDGTQVTTVAEYQAALDAHQPGDTVSILLYRAGCWYQATLPLS